MIDDLDKRILIEILKSGRISQRKIAFKLNISPQTLSYRIKRLIEKEILRDIHLYINPNFYGLYRGYVATDGELDRVEASTPIVAVFECIDGLYLYEVAFRDMREFTSIVSLKLPGKVYASFIPSQSFHHRSLIDRAIVEQLSINPRRSPRDIARALDISKRTVVRRVKRLIEGGMIKLVPIIDLSKSGLIMFSAISRSIERFIGEVRPHIVWDFTLNNTGMIIMASRDLDEAKSVIDVIRDRDRGSMISIKYRYSFYRYRV